MRPLISSCVSSHELVLRCPYSLAPIPGKWCGVRRDPRGVIRWKRQAIDEGRDAVLRRVSSLRARCGFLRGALTVPLGSKFELIEGNEHATSSGARQVQVVQRFVAHGRKSMNPLRVKSFLNEFFSNRTEICYKNLRRESWLDSN